jgi:hypothetical protein
MGRHGSVSTILVLLFFLSSCLYYGQKKKASENNNNDTEQPSALTPSSDEDGAVTASVLGGSDKDQILKASADSDISGASVLFPAGSLAVTSDVTLEEGSTLLSGSLSDDLGLDGIGFTEQGKAVAISSSVEQNTDTPFQLAFDLNESASLISSNPNLIVVYKIYDAIEKKLYFGLIPLTLLTIDGGSVKMESKHFGVFQAFSTNVLVANESKKETNKPITTKRDFAAGLSIVTGVGVTPGQSSNSITWKPVTGATEYNIYFSTTGIPSKKSEKIANATSPHLHESLTVGTTYKYALTALNDKGEGPLSEIKSGVPTEPSGASDTEAPTVVTGTTYHRIAKGESIGVVFSESLDTTSVVVVSGDDSGSNGGTFTQTNVANDTLVFGPTSEWSLGTHNFKITVKDTSGNVSTPLSVTFYVHGGIIYVSKSGVNTNPGTRSQPKLTIANAITAASGFSRPAVFVSQGTYSETISIPAEMTVRGGFSSSNWLAHSLATYPTTIDGSTFSSPTVTCTGSTSSPKTLIDYFKILVNESSTPNVGVDVSTGTNCMISDNEITVNSTTSDSAHGIRIIDAYAEVEGNHIHTLNAGGDSSYGIYVEDNASNLSGARILRNKVYSGTAATYSIGIYLLNLEDNSGSANIFSNIIVSDAIGYSYAIATDRAPGSIVNNTIHSKGTGTESHGIFMEATSGTGLKIENNIITTASGATNQYCVYEGGASYNPTSFKNNNLWDCPNMYKNDGSTPVTTIANVNAIDSYSGNIAEDPGFANFASGDLRLSAATPAGTKSSGLTDPIGGNQGFTMDIDDKERTVPWSLGAFEYD